MVIELQNLSIEDEFIKFRIWIGGFKIEKSLIGLLFYCIKREGYENDYDENVILVKFSEARLFSKKKRLDFWLHIAPDWKRRFYSDILTWIDFEARVRI